MLVQKQADMLYLLFMHKQAKHSDGLQILLNAILR